MNTLPTQENASPQAAQVETPASEAESPLIEALRRGDEAAFVWLIDKYQSSCVRLAMSFVSDRAVAEEVAQETWLGVLEGIDRFEGRSSLKTWIFRILVNTAKTRAVREGRTVAFSLLEATGEPDEPAVSPDRFRPPDDPDWPGHWARGAAPVTWNSPERMLLTRETLDQIERAIADLPDWQRQVITMRDVIGMGTDEVCNVLSITETNQRVLLHRARSKVRRALEIYMNEE